MIDLIMIILSYLFGGFSTGYYLVWFIQKQDIRNFGSGATGATNTGRILGKKGFILALLGDALKGGLITGAAIYLNLSDLSLMISLIAVVAGHIWPFHLGFRGGKGIATSLGGLMVLNPTLTISLFLGTVGLFTITRKFTLSGLLAITASPVLALLMRAPTSQVIGLSILALMILFAHRENILKIINTPMGRK